MVPAGIADGSIVNESLAKHVFPGESALGKVLMRGPNGDIRHEIVGVIADVKSNGLNAPVPDEVYYSFRQLGRLIGGDEGKNLVEGADAWMRAQEIRRPDRMAEVYAPGFIDLS